MCHVYPLVVLSFSYFASCLFSHDDHVMYVPHEREVSCSFLSEDKFGASAMMVFCLGRHFGLVETASAWDGLCRWIGWGFIDFCLGVAFCSYMKQFKPRTISKKGFRVSIIARVCCSVGRTAGGMEVSNFCCATGELYKQAQAEKAIRLVYKQWLLMSCGSTAFENIDIPKCFCDGPRR